MYNYLKDLKYFRRNAIIAADNTKDEQYDDELIIALNDNDEMLRAHAAWALGQINTQKGQEALKESLKNETSRLVSEEIKAALSD